MEDPSLREEFARDIVLLKYVGMNPVVVHGGGPEITSYMERLGLPVEFRGGLRVTSAEAMDVVKMVLVGKVNADIVTRIGRHGQAAVGLSGEDGDMFRVSRRLAPDGSDVGFVGQIDRVDVDVINHVAQDYIPVIASIGCDRDGQSHNVNADEAAGAVARALGAYKVHLPHRRRGLAARPRRRGVARQRGDRRRGAGGARGHLRRDAPEARRAASTRSTAASATRTSSTAASRTRSCSSCSPTRASARRSGRRDEPRAPPGARRRARHRHVRAAPARDRARRGRARLGRRGPRVPRPAVRHQRHEPRALPPGGRRGGARAGGHAHARVEPLLHRAGAAAGRAAQRLRRSAARSSSATPARRPTRRR